MIKFKLNIFLIILSASLCIMFSSIPASGVYASQVDSVNDTSLSYSYNNLLSTYDVDSDNDLLMQSEVLDSQNQPSLGAEISSELTAYLDVNLFDNLILQYNTLYNLEGEDAITSAYTNMLSEFTVLSIPEEAGVKSIVGLSSLTTTNLHTLNLSFSKFTSFSTSDISHITSLEKLIMVDCGLTSVDLSVFGATLTHINLSANYLTSIDLSKFTRTALINLSFNKFTSISNISLPADYYTTNLTLYLFANSIMDAEELYLSTSSKTSIELGMQGLGSNYRDTDSDSTSFYTNELTPVYFYKSDVVPNLGIRATNLYTGEKEIEFGFDTSNEEIIQKFYLTVGEFVIEFYDTETGNDIYNPYNSIANAFYPIASVIVNPKKPTITLVIKGVEYGDSYMSKVPFGATVVASDFSEHSTVYYSIAGGEWIEGEVATLNNGGTYAVNFKAVTIGSDGREYTSDASVIVVYQNLSAGLGDLVWIILIVVVLLLFVLGLLPLIIKFSKKI